MPEGIDLAALLELATRAPSPRNTQPLLFRARGDSIELHADRTPALPVDDPHERELTIRCGAALAQLEVAAAGGRRAARRGRVTPAA